MSYDVFGVYCWLEWCKIDQWTGYTLASRSFEMEIQKIIEIPSRLTLRTSIDFYNQLIDESKFDACIFDFKNANYITPFGFLFGACAIKDFRALHPEAKFTAIVYDKHSYYAHMGFFNAAGIPHGRKPNEAIGSESYIPITIKNTKELVKEAALGDLKFGELMESEAARLAQILVQKNDPEVIDILTYSIREILRNVLEHSRSPVLEYCAQYWPSKDRVEIAIVDRGVGIHKSLSFNPFLKIENEQHALNLSLLPGVSGRAYKGSVVSDHGEWANSGYGLYMAHRLCSLDGVFFLGSKSASLRMQGNKKEHLPFKFDGTAVCMVFKPSSIGNVSQALKTFEKEGAEIARTITGTVVDASTASKMLSRDFHL